MALATRIFCLVLYLAVSSGASDEHVFDYVSLVREWPFTYCTVEKCKNKQLLPNHFNIHGLWAECNDSETNRPMPMFCHVKMNESELSPLQDELQKKWTDLLDPKASAMDFWKEEFKKHGSCVSTARRFNSTYLYFSAALELDKKYNLTEILSKGGVEPSKQPINVSKISAALRENFGFLPGIRCVKHKDQAYLYELRLCFSKDLRPLNCQGYDSTLARADDDTSSALSSPPQHAAWSLLRPADPIPVGHVPLTRLLPAVATGHGSNDGTYECHSNESVLLPPAA